MSRPAHDSRNCICWQYGRCLVHCDTCHCGESGTRIYDFNLHWYRWVPALVNDEAAEAEAIAALGEEKG